MTMYLQVERVGYKWCGCKDHYHQDNHRMNFETIPKYNQSFSEYMYTSIPITIKSLSTVTLCLQSTYSNKKPLATLKSAPGNKLFRNLLASAPKTKQGTCKDARVCIPHTDSCIHGKRWLNSCNKCFKY